MGVPTYNSTIRFDDWPKPGEPFSSRFISNYADKVRQDFAFFNGGLSLNDNMNGAIVTMSMTHNVPVLVASPLRNNATPIGVLALACDTQTIPNLSITNTAVINSVTTVAPSGSVWLTAKYPLQNGYIRSYVPSASSITLSTGVVTDIQNISLTPGDWEISIGTVYTQVGGSITGTIFFTFIGTVAGNNTTGLLEGDNEAETPSTPTTASDVVLYVPNYRVSITSTTTYYQKVRATYTVGTAKSFGRISARLLNNASNTNANVTIYFAGA